MELKDYQQRVLDVFDGYLKALVVERARAEKIRQAGDQQPDPDLKPKVPDFAHEAWDVLKRAGQLPPTRQQHDYSPRKDGTGATVPSVCLKIPTGGGKTLLGVSVVSRIMSAFVSSNTGFVLWVVPSEAIYAQTKKQLADRDHPFRQMLDRTAAGKVKILEKDSPLHRADVDTHLCVMLLMLQSANRQSKETLRMFRDRGSVFGFFPPESDGEAHAELRVRIPNLDCYGSGFLSITKDSLGNVLRLVRPVVVIDEGHKAYSTSAIETIYGFNPRFVLELSATPKDRPKEKPPRFANWLVDVRGKQLADEEMVKLPINVKVKAGDDWRDCLRESLDRLNELRQAAEKLQADTDRYIRPIMLVQVERTGKDQRETGFIHAEDAREFLLHAGLATGEIAVKTSEKNELANPENADLLSRTNTVRAIITKQALQEGWDCPFAYVLCSLSASKNVAAMTQLVGRIIRQPHVKRTGIPALDECYVFCHHAETKAVVDSIKSGLEQEGMGDLAQEIRSVDDGSKDNGARRRRIPRRDTFRDVQIFLPVVNWVEGGTVRALDYEQDILAGIDWLALSVDQLADTVPLDGSHLQQSQITRVSVGAGSGAAALVVDTATKIQEMTPFDPVYATRMLVDVVPNPWVARALIGQVRDRLRARGADDATTGALSGFILEEMRKFLNTQRDALAEGVFMREVDAERIQFRLRTDRNNWEMPREIETDHPENEPQLVRPDGCPTQKSVFAPVYKAEFNSAEAECACYLDERGALEWWHRNVAKAGHYHLQGWKKNRVYPDFIFALTHDGGRRKLVVLETKGDQLAGNLDTDYKRKLLQLASDHFRLEQTTKAGELELVIDQSTSVCCDLVLISEWKTKVPSHFVIEPGTIGCCH
jgi:type III restriction enzyme